VRRPLHLLALLLLVASCTVVTACGSDDSSDSSSGSTSNSTSTPEAKKIKVGLVTDIGGLNDRSFNQLANEGLERAKSELRSLMPEDARECTGHGVRGRRSKSDAVSFDLLDMEAVHAPVQ